LKSTTKLKNSGKRIKSKAVDAWSKLRAEIFLELAEHNITSCELRLNDECLGNLFLTCCHSMKRRFIKTDEQMREVCLACVKCHEAVEFLPSEKMYKIVTETIKNRGNQSS
jgi:hypothetical protein